MAAALLVIALLTATCTQEQATESPSTTPASATATTTPSPVPSATMQPTIVAATATSTLAPAPTATAAMPPTATSRPDTDAAPSATVYEEVLRRVSDIRGLHPTEPINPQFKTRDELAAFLEEDLEEDLDEIMKVQEVLRLLELIPADANLTELLLELYTEQVAGFYDSGEEELFLIGEQQDELSVQEEVTLAHEFVHALQQQHYDIDSMLETAEDNSDAASAVIALVEGDAVSVELQYASQHITRERIQEFLSSAEGGSSVFDSTPYFLQQDLLFPYVEGPTFVFVLRRSMESGLIDQAYSNPPVSTEQVLHPQKYLSGEDPITVELRDSLAALGQGWKNVYGNVMGEFFLRTYLETRLGQGTANPIAAGWGGDRYALYSGPDGEYALVSLIVWDTARDAREFYEAMLSSQSVAPEGFLGIEGDRVLWIVSPSRQVTHALLSIWPGFG